MFENALCNRLLNFVIYLNIIPYCQHSFVKGKSTSTAIATFIDHILKLLDKKQQPVGVLYDCSKAFDIVNNNLFLSKLKHFGIRGKPNDWKYLARQNLFYHRNK